MSVRPLPPDYAARVRALTELDTNFIVEAGAGSGKTTLMAGRVVALIEDGRNPESIAAVTFTRKAADELRERIQIALETAGRDGAIASQVFVGTIHSFCARLLRERPVEAGLDPAFGELDEEQAAQYANDWWNAWLERLHLASDPALTALQGIGVEPTTLVDAFHEFVRYPDVNFSAPATALASTDRIRRQLEALLMRGFAMLPDTEPESGWDGVQSTLLKLRFEQRARDWSVPADFFEALALIPAKAKVTQIRWVRSDASAKDDKAAAKALGQDMEAWVESDVAPALVSWREYRYGPIAGFLRRASDEFSLHRMAHGRLTFEDLLMGAASLLRRDETARRSLGMRWRHLLVDEFQDTDPVQAEVLFLLGSEPTEASLQWMEQQLRPGALFVVGDPKQSIYRFRRADIETYEEAHKAIERQGGVLRLTANFRSLPAIATFVNSHFGDHGTFPDTPTKHQAAFAPLEPMRADGDGLVERYLIEGRRGESNKDDVIVKDAASIASWVEREIAAGSVKAGDVLILTRKKQPLAEIARQLAKRRIAVSVAGATVQFEAELHELQLLLQLMRDPTNTVLVAAALEGRLFGASPADLWAASQAGLAFSIAAVPTARPDEERGARVFDALQTLHEWFLLMPRTAPDVFLSHLVNETGLLAYTAADDLGDVRAGLLVRLLEDVRQATLDPERAGSAALNALDRLLSADVPDSPLLPGRTHAVRVMNLHKAKGLEGDVVILAAPTEANNHGPSVAVRRVGRHPTGGVLISEENGFQKTIIAQPPGWDEMAAEEELFQRAESDRLLYVAATRAKSRLIISEFAKELKDGMVKQTSRDWSAFAPTLDALGVPEQRLRVTDAAGRPKPEITLDALHERAEAIDAARETAALPSWTRQTVTQSAKAEAVEVKSLEYVPHKGRGAGAAWGRAVHRMIEAVGTNASLDIDAIASNIGADEEIADQAGALAASIRGLFSTQTWSEVSAASERRFEWPIAGWVESEHGPVYLEGVIDAAYRSGDGWQILDWKTDQVPDAVWAERTDAYQRQVETYGRLLERAVGEPVSARVVRVTRA
jgi:ATP-dependent helicase/nuclease subunit A